MTEPMLDDTDRRLINLLQEGIPIAPAPFELPEHRGRDVKGVA